MSSKSETSLVQKVGPIGPLVLLDTIFIPPLHRAPPGILANGRLLPSWRQKRPKSGSGDDHSSLIESDLPRVV